MASSLEGNKLMAAVLTAGIIAMGSGVVSRILYNPHFPEENAYRVEGLEGGETAVAASDAGEAEAKPLGVLLASADPSAGEGVVKKCTSCHNLGKGEPNKIGPHLWDIVNRPIGSDPDFAYSSAMKGHGGNWDYEALYAFLKAPKEYVPGTKMSFAGLSKQEDRVNLIAYLRTLSDDPAPLPPAS